MLQYMYSGDYAEMATSASKDYEVEAQVDQNQAEHISEDCRPSIVVLNYKGEAETFQLRMLMQRT